ncbi:MAG: DUF3820 family protein [Bacteroidales bacterium]|nr:DUF3820 family protein [Bacteroidales bacterium]
MLKLRSNQEAPIAKAIQFFKEKKPKPSLIVLPTAWGKSILTACVAKESNDKLLIVQPSKELLEQNYTKYITLCGGTNASIFSASCKSKQISQITYATIGSIQSLGKEFKELGFTKMLIDEAHLYPREAHSMLGTFLSDSEITHVLGITATPIKLQQGYDREGNRISKLVMLTSRSKLGNFFKNILYVGEINEMIRLGYWSPLVYKTAKFNREELKFNSTQSEYTDESITQAYNSNKTNEKIIKCLDYYDRKHILVFVPSVETAKELSTYPGSAYVSGETPTKERTEIINKFKRGEIRVLFNVGVLTTGFDCPDIDCLILARSTASVAFYYQIIGRAVRISENKRDALIIDLGGNADRFGKVEDIKYIKEGNTWRMYSGTTLLSGIPISDIGKAPIECLPFGKYQGVLLSDVPQDYLKWCLENMKLTHDIKDAILKTLASPTPLIDVISSLIAQRKASNTEPCLIPETEILKASKRTREQFNKEITELTEASLITKHKGINQNLYGL